MSNDLLITPGSRKQEFKDSSGNVDAKIETDSSGNLVITNPGGDISIGDTSADIFIGDGSSNCTYRPVPGILGQGGVNKGTLAPSMPASTVAAIIGAEARAIGGLEGGAPILLFLAFCSSSVPRGW